MKQRLHERIPVSTEIQVWDEVADELLGRLGNLSYGGLLLMAERPLPPDSVYQIRIEVRDESVDLPAVCLGVETLWRQNAAQGDRFWVGMRIIDISEADRSRLRRLMDLQRP